MSKPLFIDLFCGLGGFTEGGLAEGYECIGFDNERHDYGEGKRYPAQLVLQDVLTLHGKQFRDAALIVASPPCQEYSYMAMPWSRAKAIAAEYRSGARDVRNLTALFDACFRIQREAIEAAGHFIPLVVENVRGACPWVGRSRWNYGSFHLWGDVPALMPMTRKVAKMPGHGMSKGDPIWGPHTTGGYEGSKVPGLRFDGSDGSFQTASVEHGRKNDGGSWFNIGSPGQKEVNRNTVHDSAKLGGDWFNDRTPGCHAMMGSKSSARKAASAAIAKIPFALSRHIARTYLPMELCEHQ